MQAQKKIAQTDEIFSYVHTANRIADETHGVIRISIDTKANVKVGPFSRGGYSRQEVKASDHDFNADTLLKPFGIFLPAYDENYFYFTNTHATADFMVDALEDLWPMLKARFNPHTIAINADTGVVEHPDQWKWSGYHEIQKPKTRYRLIDHDILRGFINADTNEALAQTHREWVESQLKTRPTRQAHFSRSLTLGNEAFIRSVKQALGIRAVGRCVFKTPAAGYQLKESIAAYQSVDSDRKEKNPAMPEANTIPWKQEDALEW